MRSLVDDLIDETQAESDGAYTSIPNIKLSIKRPGRLAQAYFTPSTY